MIMEKRPSNVLHHILMLFNICREAKKNGRPPFLLLSCIILLLGNSDLKTMVAQPCESHCGKIGIPRPFGIGSQCALNDAFDLVCDQNPPRLTFAWSRGRVEVQNVDIITRTVSVLLNAMVHCLDDEVAGSFSLEKAFNLPPLFNIASKRNKFVAIGCDFSASIVSPDALGYTNGCITNCGNQTVTLSSECNGNVCCQATLSDGLKSYAWQTFTGKTARHDCKQVYIMDNDFNQFQSFSLTREERYQIVPMTLEWTVGSTSCAEAQSSTTYGCKRSSECADAPHGGYFCFCPKGSAGNPYILGGCTDVDLCRTGDTPCVEKAQCRASSEGMYDCRCPFLYFGDGRRDGSGCVFGFIIIFLVLGTIQSGIVLYFLITWIMRKQKKNREAKLQRENYGRNGGLLLEQKLQTSSGQCKNYSLRKIKKITDGFNDRRILGKGASGTVYKGLLEYGEAVAVKRSNKFDPSHIEDFTKEIVLLSDIKERNIVQLKGYCFYDQYPIIVYEYVDNGTLSDHLYNTDEDRAPLSWIERAEIATSVASAICHLHKGTDGKQVIHRDIKSQNVLLNQNRQAKLGDFGLCRTIPIDRTHVTTFKHRGTPGYIDPNMVCDFRPENDVYGYGMLLIELLTKRYPHTLNLAYRTKFADKPLSEILDDSIPHVGFEKPLQRIVKLAASCIEILVERPNMRQVAGKMEGIVKEMEMIQQQRSEAL